MEAPASLASSSAADYVEVSPYALLSELEGPGGDDGWEVIPMKPARKEIEKAPQVLAPGSNQGAR